MSFRKVYPITVFSESKSVLTKYFLDRVLRGYHSFFFFFLFFFNQTTGKLVKKRFWYAVKKLIHKINSPKDLSQPSIDPSEECFRSRITFFLLESSCNSRIFYL